MASIIKVDTIQDQDGNNIISEAANTITIGASGDTITIPSGATLANSGIITGFESTGIDDNATSTAITIDANEVVRIGNTTDVYSPTYTEFMVIGNYTAAQNNGITFLADATNSSTIGFTDDTHSTLRGGIEYNHSGDSMRFTTFTLERMRITSAGNVGIGTSSPATNLDINGSARVSTGSSYQFGGSDYKIEGSNVTSPRIGFITDSTERMRIDSTGNVGIGTSSPSNVLHIVSTNATAILQRTTAVGNNSGLSTFDFKNSDSTVSSISNFNKSGSTISTGVDGYELRLNNFGNGYTSFFNDGSERMRISGNGNIGIGTTNSTLARLYVSNDTGDVDDNGLYVYSNLSQTVPLVRIIQDGASSTGEALYIRNDGSGNAITVDDGSLGNTVFVINSSGNVGIGTTGPDAPLDIRATNSSIRLGNASQFFRIQHNDSANALVFNDNDLAERMRITSDGALCVGFSIALGPSVITSYSTVASTACYANLNSAGAGSKFHVFINSTNSAVIGSITNNGNTGTAFNTSSDYRLKENVNYNFDATTRLKQLKPARFNFIADANKTVDGFLAHEVSSIVPEAITGEKDAMKTEEYEVTPAVLDEDGNVITEAVMGTREVPDYQGIDQSKLVPLLVKTIQELEARITALETQP
jgi:hypothetical protein